MGDISEKLVGDFDLKSSRGVIDKDFSLTMSFRAALIKSTFSWKALFGSNNWRKLHGINMRRKKCLR